MHDGRTDIWRNRVLIIKYGLHFTLQVGFVVSLPCERYDFGWRIALGLESVFAAILLIGMCFFPETPRY